MKKQSCNLVFEPIAIAASGGNKALAEGIDIMIQNNETNTISAIAVKSGPSVFNADSKTTGAEFYSCF